MEAPDDATVDKVRENRARRQAARLGLALRKSRARLLHIDDRGGYAVVDQRRNRIVAGEKFDLTLQDVEGFLGEQEEELRREAR